MSLMAGWYILLRIDFARLTKFPKFETSKKNFFTMNQTPTYFNKRRPLTFRVRNMCHCLSSCISVNNSSIDPRQIQLVISPQNSSSVYIPNQINLPPKAASIPRQISSVVPPAGSTLTHMAEQLPADLMN